jgi:hypothetical protein
MTKVQVRFALRRPLDDAMMAHISDAQALYGMQQVKVDSSLDGITIVYDASRLRPAEVEAALTGFGIPVVAAVAAK